MHCGEKYHTIGTFIQQVILTKDPLEQLDAKTKEDKMHISGNRMPRTRPPSDICTISHPPLYDQPCTIAPVSAHRPILVKATPHCDN